MAFDVAAFGIDEEQVPAEWALKRLDCLASLNPEQVSAAYPHSQIVYLDIANVTAGAYGEPLALSLADAPSRAKRVVRDRDTILSTVRPGNRAFAFVRSAPDNLVASTGFAVLRAKPDADPRFVYYLATSNPIITYLASIAEEKTAYPSVNPEDIAECTVPVPPRDEQRAIAHILGTLDDKIELNRRMSETLEAMARALFKSWFVDFDPVRAKAEGRDPGLPKPLADLFPARLVDSELGEIPEGWEVGALGDLCDVEKGLSYKGEGLTDDGGLPMVNLGCFAGGGAFKSENIKRYRGDFKERHLVRAGDLLVANTDMTQNRIILGSPALLPEMGGEQRFLFTHHTFAFRFKSGAERWRRYLFFTLLQPGFREIADGFATGTTVLALPRDGLLNLALVFPPDPLLQAFERQVEVLLASADKRRRQSRTIAALRDTLLPKLISGELRASEAASLVEATA